MRRLRILFGWTMMAALATAPLSFSLPSFADDESLEGVDQRVKILERKAELAAEEAAAKAKDAVVVGAGKDGFFLRSADGKWQFKLRGFIQADARSFTDDDQKPGIDTFVMRRVRPIFEGTVGKIFDFRLVPDFGAGQTVLFDAYADLRFSPKASLRVGKFKPPIGLERLQSAQDTLFVERALPTNLVPTRDLGLQLHGEFAAGALTYQVGVFNGVPDAGNADVDPNNSKDVALRIFALPFKNTAVHGLRGLGLGVAASEGKNKGTTTSTGLAGFRSAGTMTFFSYRTDTPATAVGTVVGDGDRSRLTGQAYYYLGRFGAITEYVRSSQDVRIDTTSGSLDNTAWQVAASFMLTPDLAAFKTVSPKNPFDLAANTFGAFELVARASTLDVDDAAFPVFANPASSASKAQAWAAGINWYLSRNMKIMLDYEETEFTGGAATGDRETEKIFFNRFQVSF